MAKAPRMSVWSVTWHSPYTSPPNGQPRTLVRIEVSSDGPHWNKPPEQIAETVKMNPGYCAAWSPVPGEKRPWPVERKAKFRRAALRRRIERVAPLFADELQELEISRRPDYFDGQNQ